MKTLRAARLRSNFTGSYKKKRVYSKNSFLLLFVKPNEPESEKYKKNIQIIAYNISLN